MGKIYKRDESWVFARPRFQERAIWKGDTVAVFADSEHVFYGEKLESEDSKAFGFVTIPREWVACPSD